MGKAQPQAAFPHCFTRGLGELTLGPLQAAGHALPVVAARLPAP